MKTLTFIISLLIVKLNWDFKRATLCILVKLGQRAAFH